MNNFFLNEIHILKNFEIYKKIEMGIKILFLALINIIKMYMNFHQLKKEMKYIIKKEI